MAGPGPEHNRRLTLPGIPQERNNRLLVLFGVIGVALIVLPIAIILIGRSADRSLDELSTEVDPVSIRLSRAHVDVVSLMNDSTRISLSTDPDHTEYESARLRYTASRTLLTSAARATPYEDDVLALTLLMDEAAAAADDGMDALLAGDPEAADAHLTERGAGALDTVAERAEFLRERLDQDAHALRAESRQMSRFELIAGVGGSLLGAVAVLSLVGIELARRRLTLEQERDRARFSGMVEATGFGVVELNQQGTIEYANPAASDILQYTLEELLNSDEDCFLPTEADDDGRLRDAFVDGEPYFGTERFLRRDGESLIVEVSCAIVDRPSDDPVPGGRRHRVVLVFQDLTERTERERQQAEFLAVASHELRTPLTSIVGFSRRLVRGVERGRIDVDEETREEIETLNNEAERMRQMVSLFLDMSRLDANALDLDFEEVEITEVVDEEADMLRQRRPDVQVHLDFPGDEAMVESDERRARQVISNLLDNAVKYGGDPPAITIRVAPEDGGYAVYVRDNGGGISDDDRERVFDRFYRSQVTASQRQGLGLGLHISRELAQILGASLMLTEHQPGSGAEFRFWLPGEAEDGAGRSRQRDTARLTWSTRS